MTERVRPDLIARLHRVAIDFVIPAGLHVDDAVRVAEDLVASGFEGGATLDVAILDRNSVGSDAERLVRAMLSEHGIEVQVTGEEDARYGVLLRGFGSWDLSIRYLEESFYARIPEWDDQDPLDRALVTMLDERDQLTTPAERDAVVRRMRAVVREHVAAG